MSPLEESAVRVDADRGDSRLRKKPSSDRVTVEAEDVAGPLPRFARRTSSFHTDSSLGSGRFTMSTEDLLLPKSRGPSEELHQEPSLWHSLPLLLAVLPAIGGVAHRSAATFITDLVLLVLAALYLNWCLVTPWIWYHAAQTVKVAGSTPPELAVDDDIDDAGGELDGHSVLDEPSATPTDRADDPDKLDRTSAAQELRLHESSALLLCFLGPLIGAYILHVIRSQLSLGGGHEMVSDLHLTMFVLGAEIRPMRYLMKMGHARTIYLQRIVREDPHQPSDRADTSAVQDIGARLDELEVAVGSITAPDNTKAATISSESMDSLKKSQAAVQSQIDALNRAVRRYEKRATAQTLQTEGRLQDLESRLRDALSLAAAAANYSQKPGIVAVLLQSISSIIAMPLHALQTMIKYPLWVVSTVLVDLLVKLGVVRMQPRRPGVTSSKSNVSARPGREAGLPRKPKR